MNPLFEWFHRLDEAKRKLVIFGLALFLAIGFLMFPSLSTLHRMFFITPQTHPSKPSPFDGSVYPPVFRPAPALPVQSVLIGNWQGNTRLSDGSTCDLKLEIRPQAVEPPGFKGYSSLTCVALSSFINPQPRGNVASMLALMTEHVAPTSAILTGIPQKDDAIRFVVEKLITPPQAHNGCAPSSFTATPFGRNQLAAEWQDGCHGGQAILRKIGP